LKVFNVNNHRMSKRIFLLSVITATSLSASAQSPTNLNGTVNTVTTAVPFLRISPDARSGAMGDVGVAITPDANAQFWNVSKLPFTTKKYGVSLTYTPWLKDLVPDIFLAYIAAYGKFGTEGNQTISGSLRYFSLGEITYTGLAAEPLGSGKPNEMALDAGYARKLSPNLSTGLTFRYIHSAIATGLAVTPGTTDYRPGNAFGADLGVYYTKTKDLTDARSTNLSLGAVLSNLGTKISYSNNRKDFIPMNLGLGGAYTYQADEYNKVTFALDINKLLVPTPQDTNAIPDGKADVIPDKPVVSAIFSSFGDAQGGFKEELREYQISLGAEYWYQNQFAVRAGYFYENKFKGDRQYVACGIGVRYNVFNLNFSYLIPSGGGINRNPLSNTLRFSLIFEFEGKKAQDDNTISTIPSAN
jgi:hypothetical protein